MAGEQVFADQRGRKRSEHHGEQQEAVRIDECRRRLVHESERRMVVDPRDQDDGETQHERDERWREVRERTPQVASAADDCGRWNLDVDDQQCESDGEYPIAEGFEPCVGMRFCHVVSLFQSTRRGHSRPGTPFECSDWFRKGTATVYRDPRRAKRIAVRPRDLLHAHGIG